MTARPRRGRLLLTSHYFHPHVGGIETVLKAHAEGLVRRGWDVTICTSRLRGDERTEAHVGATVRRTRAWNVLERSVRVPVPLVSPTQLLAMREARPEVIVAHGHTYLSSVYAALAARLLRVPLVVVQHSPWVEYPFPLDVVERIADRSIGRFVLHSATEVVVVSGFTGAFVAEIAPRAALQVVYSGVDARYRPTPPREGPQRLRVATLRRLVPRQGVDVLIDAWRSARCGDVADLSIGGDGPERDALVARAGGDPSIGFLGRVPDAEMESFYSACDVFVLPTSSGEGFGLVAAEALASGRPVIATRPGGPSELVRDGVDGLLVDASDSAGLGAALRSLLEDEPRRVAMSSRAAERDLSWTRAIDEIERVLDAVRRPAGD
ncbi:MAG: glycosyltransferase [Actinobacteria bacterium]|jgi:glycosyltransferase involved in cell wall biosynthesis|uniref:Unannotated protein n=1 Tax=freshwater metagenome TaxID=449393 RepID=A0A6J6CYV4_9ZZZZ|nr:glycosyltransferase [Actinomycetota bacterium]